MMQAGENGALEKSNMGFGK